MKHALAVVIIGSMLAAPALAADDFPARILAAQNVERASVSVSPLTWSDGLAADAAVWAKQLASTGKFGHSPPDTRKGEGESLWVGTAGSYSPEEMVGGWAAEKSSYRYGAFTNGTTDGQVTGHYTQMIWKNSTTVGCAKASGGGYDVLVCRYSPAGNAIGEKPY
jgi:uncharacterized protein YkwD